MSALDIVVPEDLEGTKSVVRNWLKQVGDAVALDEPLVELETDKVAMEVFSQQAGVLREILFAPGQEAAPGDILGRMSALGEAVPPPGPSPSTQPHEALPATPPAPTEPAGPAADRRGSIADFDPALRLSPSVRRLLQESGADPNTITGTGRDGRLTRADVQAFVATGPRGAPAPVQTPIVAARGAPVGRRVPHDTIRRRIAEHMVHSVTVAPHVTAVFEADFGAISAHRQAHKAAFAAQGVNLTYTAYLVSACVQAMAAAPAVNSRWHDDALEIFDDINIGVGASLGEKGLIVPVVHQAQTLSLLGIAQRLQAMTEGARAGKLKPADVQGGTFSISNHGVSGSLVAAPIIINQPQSAILGVGKLEKRAVVRELDGADAIAIRPMAYVSLTIDHRVLDGHQTNAWLTRFVEVLQTWPPA